MNQIALKKPPIMAFSALDYKGFPDLISKWRDKALI